VLSPPFVNLYISCNGGSARHMPITIDTAIALISNDFGDKK
jgi:hypothetical protein